MALKVHFIITAGYGIDEGYWKDEVHDEQDRITNK